MAHKKTTNKPRLVSSRERSIAVLARSRTQHGKATLGLPTASARGDAAYPLTSHLGLAGRSEALFASFWMGGYEGADHVNSTGRPISLRDVAQHESQAAQDYARLADFGIRTVRVRTALEQAICGSTSGCAAHSQQYRAGTQRRPAHAIGAFG